MLWRAIECLVAEGRCVFGSLRSWVSDDGYRRSRVGFVLNALFRKTGVKPLGSREPRPQSRQGRFLYPFPRRDVSACIFKSAQTSSFIVARKASASFWMVKGLANKRI